MTMKAIVTTFRGATVSRPARIVARAEGVRSLTYAADKALSDDPHQAAALALCERMGWDAKGLVKGTLPNRDRVFVFADRERRYVEAIADMRRPDDLLSVAIAIAESALDRWGDPSAPYPQP
jgi:hypothetical protein